MLTSVHLRDFKCHANTFVDLAPLTVLVGPNAAGKSSLLTALHLVSRLQHESPYAVFTGEQSFPALIRKGQFIFNIVLENEPEQVQLQIAAVANAENEEVEYSAEGRQAKSRQETRIILKPSLPEAVTAGVKVDIPGPRAVWNQIAPTILLRLDVRELFRPTDFNEPHPRIGVTGTGLTAVLADMHLTRPDEFRQFEDSAQRIIPSIRRIRFDKTEFEQSAYEAVETRSDVEMLYRKVKRRVIGLRLVLDMDSGDALPAETASEGTLLTLGILAALAGPQRPRLALLDDLDRGLHPRAAGALIAAIRAIQQDSPDLQIIATSHSPYLLDHLDPHEIRLLSIGEGGTTEVANLTDHPQFDRWKDIMKPGEFWGMVGEDWVKGVGSKG